jgi:pyridoxal phosphate enzyme (YggS family)
VVRDSDSTQAGARDDALAGRASELRERVAQAAARAGRDPATVSVVAVTKTVPAAVVRAAHALGFAVFGENRVQEAQAKIAELGRVDIRWELIGHLQSNKAARAVELFDRVQSVDSVRLAELLNAQAARRAGPLPVLLEVNVAGEASKSGFAPDELTASARAVAALPHLAVEGLMTVAPLVEHAEAARPVFRRLRDLRDELRVSVPIPTHASWDALSMGMSDDFEVAIEEGATVVRIGRALFGDRPKV